MDYVLLYEQQYHGFYGWNTSYLIFKAENDDDANQKAFELIGRKEASMGGLFRSKGIAKIVTELKK